MPGIWEPNIWVSGVWTEGGLPDADTVDCARYYYYLENQIYDKPATPTPKHKYNNSIESDEAAQQWRTAQEKRRRIDYILTEVAKDRIREDNRRMNRSVRNRNFGE
jgi:hypothetical protein